MPEVREALHNVEADLTETLPGAEVRLGPIEFLLGERVQVTITVTTEVRPDPSPHPRGDEPI